ncbi:SdiA-regulated domain-containing protein [Christiangramia sediminis]|uniref:SdiA-regulated domain-containing protein n=1 Tax=Christiangramia sediminis TaxID=2881336 RepID=A0A9X1RUW2_9FLAO|nr:SdiA-regulated domain-containing protein [Christiangramia sediminis]MCB7479796.1 SdiA-regulated domain-containing protein [Christiangramia sediminis]
MTRKILGIVAIVLVLAGIVAFSFSNKFEKGIASKANAEREYTIKNKWDLPEVLEEVSGIHYYAPNKLASVQDEDGTIFIYDLDKKEIEKEINFAGSGDYEALTIKDQDAYVLRSDGVLFEIKNFLKNPKIIKYDPDIDHSVNFEGLCFAKESGKLLMITKEEDVEDGVKNVYSFDLTSKSFDKSVPFKLETEKGIFKDYKGSFRPSEIEINPKTGEYYVLDGKNPRLLILNSSFKVLRLISLDEDDFEQPEGISFDDEGRLFISNEAGKNDANILEIHLNPDK